jgi:hypothetical protein
MDQPTSYSNSTRTFCSFSISSYLQYVIPRMAAMVEDMTIQRMDNVLIVVDDLETAKGFFAKLGMELEGEAPVEGRTDVKSGFLLRRTRFAARLGKVMGAIGFKSPNFDTDVVRPDRRRF